MAIAKKPRDPTDIYPIGPQIVTDNTVEDLRFRRLLSREEWNALPKAVRRGFTKRHKDTDVETYIGKIIGAICILKTHLGDFL